MDVDDLAIASLATARSIVVLAPEGDEPDADVIKTILAITNDPDAARSRTTSSPRSATARTSRSPGWWAATRWS